MEKKLTVSSSLLYSAISLRSVFKRIIVITAKWVVRTVEQLTSEENDHYYRIYNRQPMYLTFTSIQIYIPPRSPFDIRFYPLNCISKCHGRWHSFFQNFDWRFLSFRLTGYICATSTIIVSKAIIWIKNKIISYLWGSTVTPTTR